MDVQLSASDYSVVSFPLSKIFKEIPPIAAVAIKTSEVGNYFVSVSSEVTEYEDSASWINSDSIFFDISSNQVILTIPPTSSI